MLYKWLKRWAMRTEIVGGAPVLTWRHNFVCRLSARYEAEWGRALDAWCERVLTGCDASRINRRADERGVPHGEHATDPGFGGSGRFGHSVKCVLHSRAVSSRLHAPQGRRTPGLRPAPGR